MPEIRSPQRVMHSSLECKFWMQKSRIRCATELGRLATAVNHTTGVVAIEHVGSSAVPGLAGQPIIDILVGVRAWPPTAELRRALRSLGYEELGEAALRGRLGFRLRTPIMGNVAVVRHDAALWTAELGVRDLLRADAALRRDYSATKRRAIADGKTSLLAYSEHKRAFMEGLARRVRGRRPPGSR